MEQKHVQIIIGVLIAIALLFAASWYFSSSTGEIPGGGSQIAPPNDTPAIAEPLVTITAKHQFNDSTHIVAGEYGVPTPCHILETEVEVAEPIPETVTIHFITRTEAEVCAQVITRARFKVFIEADENANIQATLNGKDVILNLIDARPDEDLEEFELFIKG